MAAIRTSGALPQIASGVAFPYPPATAIVFAPFALLGHGASEALFTLLCMLSVLAALRVLGVRDWRLYGLVIIWPPVVAAWQTANLTLPLALVIALAWQQRTRALACGLFVAVALALKPSLAWPLALWLASTRRYRATLVALGVAAIANAAALALIGAPALRRYVELDGTTTRALDRDGYGVIALAAHLGAGRAAGALLELALACGLAVACVLVGRRGREREALTLAICLMLAASPLVWNHYLALLVVPLALAYPTISWPWLVGLGLWLCPSVRVEGWQAVALWIIAATIVAATVKRRERPRGGLRPARSAGRPPRAPF